MSGDSVLRSALALVSQGIPFDVAFALEIEERLAWTVILGEINGGKFNWEARRWERDD